MSLVCSRYPGLPYTRDDVGCAYYDFFKGRFVRGGLAPPYGCGSPCDYWVGCRPAYRANLRADIETTQNYFRDEGTRLAGGPCTGYSTGFNYSSSARCVPPVYQQRGPLPWCCPPGPYRRRFACGPCGPCGGRVYGFRKMSYLWGGGCGSANCGLGLNRGGCPMINRCCTPAACCQPCCRSYGRTVACPYRGCGGPANLLRYAIPPFGTQGGNGPVFMGNCGTGPFTGSSNSTVSRTVKRMANINPNTNNYQPLTGFNSCGAWCPYPCGMYQPGWPGLYSGGCGPYGFNAGCGCASVNSCCSPPPPCLPPVNGFGGGCCVPTPCCSPCGCCAVWGSSYCGPCCFTSVCQDTICCNVCRRKPCFCNQAHYYCQECFCVRCCFFRTKFVSKWQGDWWNDENCLARVKEWYNTCDHVQGCGCKPCRAFRRHCRKNEIRVPDSIVVGQSNDHGDDCGCSSDQQATQENHHQGDCGCSM